MRLRVTLLWYRRSCFSNVIMLTRYWSITTRSSLASLQIKGLATKYNCKWPITHAFWLVLTGYRIKDRRIDFSDRPYFLSVSGRSNHINHEPETNELIQSFFECSPTSSKVENKVCCKSRNSCVLFIVKHMW